MPPGNTIIHGPGERTFKMCQYCVKLASVSVYTPPYFTFLIKLYTKFKCTTLSEYKT